MLVRGVHPYIRDIRSKNMKEMAKDLHSFLLLVPEKSVCRSTVELRFFFLGGFVFACLFLSTTVELMLIY